jgi:hypothetical protein
VCCVKRVKSLALPVFFLKIFRNLKTRQQNTGMEQKCYVLRITANLFYFFLPYGIAHSPIPSRNFMVPAHRSGGNPGHVFCKVCKIKPCLMSTRSPSYFDQALFILQHYLPLTVLSPSLYITIPQNICATSVYVRL